MRMMTIYEMRARGESGKLPGDHLHKGYLDDCERVGGVEGLQDQSPGTGPRVRCAPGQPRAQLQPRQAPTHGEGCLLSAALKFSTSIQAHLP